MQENMKEMSEFIPTKDRITHIPYTYNNCCCIQNLFDVLVKYLHALSFDDILYLQ